MIKKILLFFILFVSYFVFFGKFSYANEVLFQDDFSNEIDGSNASNWDIVDGDKTNWKIESIGVNKYYVNIIDSDKLFTSYMVVNNTPGSFNWDNYVIEAQLMASNGVDQLIIFRVNEDFKTYYEIDLRYLGCADCNNIRIAKRINGNYFKLGDLSSSELSYNVIWNTFYNVKISVINNEIKVFINDKNIFNYTDNLNPILKGKIGLWGYNGGWEYGAKYYYSKIKVSTAELNQSTNPILFIPGHGASWNLNAMTNGAIVGPWKKTPFVNTYNNLRNTILSSSDFKENENYLEFYYDWRKRISLENSTDDLATDLKNYIENIVLKDKPPDTKINIISHSMGGLLSRAYIQKYGGNKVNKLITVGTPNLGAIKAYQAWEGGQVSTDFDWSSLAFQLLLQVNKNLFDTDMTAVRNLAPSTQDLFPTFDFLKNNQTESIISINNLNQKNLLLNKLNTELTDNQKSIINIIQGKESHTDKDTIEWIRVTEPNWLDNLLGLWIDGHPLNYEYTPDGDLTVLKKSAVIPGIQSYEITGDHSEIIQSGTGISKILNLLDLSTINPITSTNSLIIKPSLIFFLHSPANIKVNGPNGETGEGAVNQIPDSIYSPEDKLIVIPNAQSGNYNINILGTDSGEFNLEIGQLTLNNELWKKIKGKIDNSEMVQLSFNFDQNTTTEDLTADNSLVFARKRLESLNDFIENNNEVNFSTKRRFQFLIKKEIETLTKAIDSTNKSNYLQSSKYIMTGLADCIQYRNELNRFNKENKLPVSITNYVRNEMIEVGNLLRKAWLLTNAKSGTKVNPSLVNAYKQTTESGLNSLTTKLMSKGINYNPTIGNAFSLARNYQSIANASLSNNNLEEAYINYYIVRILNSEIKNLL